MTTTYLPNKYTGYSALGDAGWGPVINATAATLDSAFGGNQAFALGAASGVVSVSGTSYVGAYPANTPSYVPLSWTLTGTLAANVNLQIPSGVGGQWLINNTCTMGAYTITVSAVSGSTSQILLTGTQTVYSDGAGNIYTLAAPATYTVTVSTTGGTTTLTYPQTACLNLVISGTLASNATINFQSTPVGFCFVQNNTTGAFAVTLGGVSGGGTVVIPQGNTAQLVWHDSSGATSYTASGNVTMSGSAIQQINMTQSGGGAVNLSSNANIAYLTNFGTSDMVFTVANSAATFQWVVNGVHVAVVNSGGLSVANPITSTSGGFKFPNTSTQLVAAADQTVRQTVISGPDASGSPNWLPATSASLTLTMQNVSTGTNALIVTVANASAQAGGGGNVLGVSTSNLSWTLPASTSGWLVLNVSVLGVLTTAYTVVQPTYQYGGAASVTSGAYTYNIEQGIMYLGNGSTASAVLAVVVGEFTTSGSAVTAALAYAHNGYYDSGFTATLPGTATLISKNSNLGVTDINSQLLIQCTTAENGYSIGDQISNPITSNGTAWVPILIGSTRLTTFFTTGASVAFAAQNKTTGAQVTLTSANWKYKLISKRAW
jgi:hypothetical protein